MSKALSPRWSNSSTIGSTSPQSKHGWVLKYQIRYSARFTASACFRREAEAMYRARFAR